MPIQLFQIFLDKGRHSLKAGERITGKFVIVVSDTYSHNGIYLKFEGHAITKWTEDSSCFQQRGAKQQHRARKQFFDTIFKYASEETLRDGTHIFPFEYQLPSNLPSSLATPTITIWYKMEALIQKNPKPRREVVVFPVQGQLDLNNYNPQQDDLTSPVSEVKSNSMLAFYPPCFCSLNYASIGVRVAKRGFTPGERVTVNLALLTDTYFTFVSLSLIQEITVVTKEKTMIERRTTVKLSLPDLTPDESDDYRRWSEELVIPEDSVVSSNEKDYPDIKISYFIKFTAEATKFPYKLMKILTPLTIGSVPLLETKAENDEVDDDDNNVIHPDGGGGDDPFVPCNNDTSTSLSMGESGESVETKSIPNKADVDEVGSSSESGVLAASPSRAKGPPPTIVIVQLEPEVVSPTQKEEEQDYSSPIFPHSSNFLLQFPSSTSYSDVTPSSIPVPPPPPAVLSTSSPAKGALRRVSITESGGKGSKCNSPAKRLAFQEGPRQEGVGGSSPGRVTPSPGPSTSYAFNSI